MTDQTTDSGIADEQYKEEAAAEAAQKAAAEKEETESETEGEGDSKNTAKKEEKQAEDAEAGDGEGKESEGDKGFEDTDTPEVPSRNASYILQRKLKKEAKAKAKVEEEADKDVEEAEGDDDTTAAEEESEVDRSVKKHLEPIIGTLKEQADEKELKELFDAEPESKGYAKAIRAFMKHPAWNQVPPAAIFHHLHFQHAASVGARKKALADKEAGQTRTTGSTRRSSAKTKSGNFPSAEEIDSMSDEELEKLQADVQAGKFAPKSK